MNFTTKVMFCDTEQKKNRKSRSTHGLIIRRTNNKRIVNNNVIYIHTQTPKGSVFIVLVTLFYDLYISIRTRARTHTHVVKFIL